MAAPPNDYPNKKIARQQSRWTGKILIDGANVRVSPACVNAGAVHSTSNEDGSSASRNSTR
jgi:hypothetical protein